MTTGCCAEKEYVIYYCPRKTFALHSQEGAAMKTTSVVVRLDPDEKARLHSISQESSETTSETIRRLIEDNKKVDPRVQAIVNQLLPAIKQAMLELAGQPHD